MQFKKYSKLKRINFKRKKKYNNLLYFFRFGDKALFTVFQIRIEKIYLKIIRRIIRKKYRKKRKKLIIHNRYWIRFNQNLFLTKKSKNARMGSGRGKYHRSCFVLKRNQSMLEFKNFDYYYICFLRYKLYFRLNIELLLLADKYRKLCIT